MKHVVFLLFVLFAFISCTHKQIINEKKDFEISIDTLTVHLKDFVKPATKISLSDAIKYNDKYYCFFYEYRYAGIGYSETRFTIISENGTIEHYLEAPYDMFGYYDLFLMNDSILVKNYYTLETYYFDTNKLKWEQVKEAVDLIYEDNDFYITHLSFGEWGQTTWFRDKKTNKEYELASYGNIVNKIDSIYYITANNQIVMIEDPLKLKPCEPDYYYDIVRKNKHNDGSRSLCGTQILYEDTTFWWTRHEENKSYIITSFVHNNQMFHLYSEKDTIYIAKFENGNFEFLKKVADDISCLGRFYSYRMNIQKDNRQLINFETKTGDLYGFIEIHNNGINLRYLKHDVDSVKHIGSDSFATIFGFIYDNFDNLSISEINALEQKACGLDMQDEKVGLIVEKMIPIYNKFETWEAKNYLKIENSFITNTNLYFYTVPDSLVRAIFLEWRATRPYYYDHISEYENRNNPDRINAFEMKFEDIKESITQKMNTKPTRKNRGNGYYVLNWKGENGLIVNLYLNELRMVIYKE